MQLDPRFQNAVALIRSGTFGWEDIFESLVESVTTGGDYYLVANDFPAYVDCQVCPDPMPACHRGVGLPWSAWDA